MTTTTTTKEETTHQESVTTPLLAYLKEHPEVVFSLSSALRAIGIEDPVRRDRAAVTRAIRECTNGFEHVHPTYITGEETKIAYCPDLPPRTPRTAPSRSYVHSNKTVAEIDFLLRKHPGKRWEVMDLYETLKAKGVLTSPGRPPITYSTFVKKVSDLHSNRQFIARYGLSVETTGGGVVVAMTYRPESDASAETGDKPSVPLNGSPFLGFTPLPTPVDLPSVVRTQQPLGVVEVIVPQATEPEPAEVAPTDAWGLCHLEDDSFAVLSDLDGELWSARRIKRGAHIDGARSDWVLVKRASPRQALVRHTLDDSLWVCTPIDES